MWSEFTFSLPRGRWRLAPQKQESLLTSAAGQVPQMCDVCLNKWGWGGVWGWCVTVAQTRSPVRVTFRHRSLTPQKAWAICHESVTPGDTGLKDATICWPPAYYMTLAKSHQVEQNPMAQRPCCDRLAKVCEVLSSSWVFPAWTIPTHSMSQWRGLL